MTADKVVEYLETVTLTDALWWFIENQEPTWSTEVFFYLRERYRNSGDCP